MRVVGLLSLAGAAMAFKITARRRLQGVCKDDPNGDLDDINGCTGYLAMEQYDCDYDLHEYSDDIPKGTLVKNVLCPETCGTCKNDAMPKMACGDVDDKDMCNNLEPCTYRRGMCLSKCSLKNAQNGCNAMGDGQMCEWTAGTCKPKMPQQGGEDPGPGEPGNEMNCAGNPQFDCAKSVAKCTTELGIAAMNRERMGQCIMAKWEEMGDGMCCGMVMKKMVEEMGGGEPGEGECMMTIDDCEGEKTACYGRLTGCGLAGGELENMHMQGCVQATVHAGEASDCCQKYIDYRWCEAKIPGKCGNDGDFTPWGEQCPVDDTNKMNDGKLKLTADIMCDDRMDPFSFSIDWTPDCQKSPIYDGEPSSPTHIRARCHDATSGAIVVSMYGNGMCSGTPMQEVTLGNGQCIEPEEPGESRMAYHWDAMITKECGIAEDYEKPKDPNAALEKKYGMPACGMEVMMHLHHILTCTTKGNTPTPETAGMDNDERCAAVDLDEGRPETAAPADKPCHMRFMRDPCYDSPGNEICFWNPPGKCFSTGQCGADEWVKEDMIRATKIECVGRDCPEQYVLDIHRAPEHERVRDGPGEPGEPGEPGPGEEPTEEKSCLETTCQGYLMECYLDGKTEPGDMMRCVRDKADDKKDTACYECTYSVLSPGGKDETFTSGEMTESCWSDYAFLCMTDCAITCGMCLYQIEADVCKDCKDMGCSPCLDFMQQCPMPEEDGGGEGEGSGDGPGGECPFDCRMWEDHQEHCPCSWIMMAEHACYKVHEQPEDDFLTYNDGKCADQIHEYCCHMHEHEGGDMGCKGVFGGADVGEACRQRANNREAVPLNWVMNCDKPKAMQERGVQFVPRSDKCQPDPSGQGYIKVQCLYELEALRWTTYEDVGCERPRDGMTGVFSMKQGDCYEHPYSMVDGKMTVDGFNWELFCGRIPPGEEPFRVGIQDQCRMNEPVETMRQYIFRRTEDCQPNTNAMPGQPDEFVKIECNREEKDMVTVGVFTDRDCMTRMRNTDDQGNDMGEREDMHLTSKKCTMEGGPAFEFDYDGFCAKDDGGDDEKYTTACKQEKTLEGCSGRHDCKAKSKGKKGNKQLRKCQSLACKKHKKNEAKCSKAYGCEVIYVGKKNKVKGCKEIGKK